jgi:hypothetical protein
MEGGSRPIGVGGADRAAGAAGGSGGGGALPVAR